MEPSWCLGYKPFFGGNSTEHKIFDANKCKNANNYTTVGILTFISVTNFQSERIFTIQHFSIYEQFEIVCYEKSFRTSEPDQAG